MSNTNYTQMDEETTETNEPSAGEHEKNDILSVSDLTKIYPDGTLAVDDIEFSVQEGDFCVIIGPSGCGKSTTLHSLVGKVEATDGTIALDGEDITNERTYDRDIGLVFQDFQLFPHLTVEENIRYGLKRIDVPAAEADERVEEMMSTMRLSEMADRDPTELSAGQKQRVALARSMVLEPKLILLDEPLGDMDYKLQKRMERELLRIHRQFDMTFVYVTHDQTQAMRLADQVVVMNDGRIEQSGSVNEVYNQPETAFVATFVGDSNLFHGTLLGVTDGVAQVETPYGTFDVTTSNLHSVPDELLGEELTFSVRPQHLSIDETAANTLTCDVLDIIRHAEKGTQVLLEAMTEQGDTMELQLKSQTHVEELKGQATVGWESHDATLLEQTSVVDGVDLETVILGE